MVVNVMTFRAEFIRDNHNGMELLNWRETVTKQFQNPTQCPQPWMLMISLWRNPPPQHLKTKQKEKERQRIWKRSVSKSRRYSSNVTRSYFTKLLCSNRLDFTIFKWNAVALWAWGRLLYENLFQMQRHKLVTYHFLQILS